MNVTLHCMDLIESAIEKFSQPGEIIAWDVFWGPGTSPDGKMVPLVMVMMSMKNPLIGQPALMGFYPIDWIGFDSNGAAQLTQGMVARLRAVKANLIAGGN